MTLRAMLMGLAAMMLLAGPTAAQEITKVTLADTAKVARKAEPVTNGVPLPKGLIKDAGDLSLRTAEGKDVPASFSVLCKWPDDGSIRWALLDTQADVPAGGATVLSVVQGKAVVAKPVLVEDAAESVTVNTGVLKFTVRKKGFRLFEFVWLDESGQGRFDDAHKVLAECPEGLAMTVHGKRYTSAGDESSAVTVEEKTPMRVALLATGKLAGGGGDGYDYQVRIHAYAGSAQVRVVPTVIKKFGKRRDITQTFEDLSFALKLAAAKDLTYALGGEAAPATGKLDAGAKASVSVKSSDEWTFGGAATGSGKCKTTKPLTLGWADLSGANGGVAVGVYRFWQVFPKAIEVSGDGTVDVGLMPKRLGVSQEFYTGMARTHEVLVVFHGKAVPAASLQDRFVALQAPLFAATPAEWLCQETQALGPLAAAGTPLPGNAMDEIKKEDAHVLGLYNQLMTTWQDNCPRGGIDAYGFLAYGDTIHYIWDAEPGGSRNKWNVAWDSHYYDQPHLACLMWARTGERKLLDFFVDNTWHEKDVSVIHWDDDRNSVRGGSRRCPATNHVGMDPPAHKEPIWNAFDHHKSESLFDRYFLLGDRFALESANDLLYLADRPAFGDGQAGSRTGAHQALTLIQGYWLTGEKKYLEHAKKLVEANIARQDKNDGGFNANDSPAFFADGILAEALCKYYLATGDEQVLKAVERFADWNIAHPKGLWASNGSMAHALAYNKTGDEKYLKSALSFIHKGNAGNLGKDMAMSWRNYPYVSGLIMKTAK